MFIKRFTLYRSPDDGAGGGQAGAAGASASASQPGSSGSSASPTDYQALYAQQVAAHEAFVQETNNRYSGLMSTYTKEHEAHEGTKGALTATTSKVQGFEAQLSELNGKYESTLKEHQAKLGELTGLQSKAARLELIVKEFPDLAGFEAKGLLPIAETPEKLKDLFNVFRTEIGARTEAARKQNLEGGTPPQPAGTGDPTPASKAGQLLKDATNALLVEHDEKKYNDLYGQYLKAKESVAPSK